MALPTFERRVAQDARPADHVRPRHEPAGHAAAPGRAPALAHAAGPARPRADAEDPAQRTCGRSIDASKAGFPAASQSLEDAAAAARPARPGHRSSSTRRSTVPRPLQARADVVLRQHGRGHGGQRQAGHAPCTTCARPTRSTRRTSPRIPSGCRRTGRTRTGCRAAFDQINQGLPVYENRLCNSSNLAADRHQRAAAGGRRRDADRERDHPLPNIGLPPIPQLPITPQQAQALIPDELLQQIQQFAFGGATNGGAVPAPPCRQQGKYTFGGETDPVPAPNARPPPAEAEAGRAGRGAGAGPHARGRRARRARAARCWRCGCAQRGHEHAGLVAAARRLRATADDAPRLRRRRGLRARARATSRSSS